MKKEDHTIMTRYQVVMYPMLDLHQYTKVADLVFLLSLGRVLLFTKEDDRSVRPDLALQSTKQ